MSFSDPTLAKIAELFTKPRIKRVSKETLHPSAASAYIQTGKHKRLVGKCHRQQWYTKHKTEISNPIDAQNYLKMDIGNITHEWFVELTKKARLYHADEISIYDPETRISGRIDLITIHPDTNHLVGWELKSVGDYMLKYIKDGPKNEHILQTLIYMHYMKDSVKDWNILYISRGLAEFKQFNMHLDYMERPVINGRIFDITFEDILDRYKELTKKLASDEIPERDYELLYDRPRLLEEISDGNLTAAQTRKVMAGNKCDIGDWQCRYCNYKSLCWDLDK